MGSTTAAGSQEGWTRKKAEMRVFSNDCGGQRRRSTARCLWLPHKTCSLADLEVQPQWIVPVVSSPLFLIPSSHLSPIYMPKNRCSDAVPQIYPLLRVSCSKHNLMHLHVGLDLVWLLTCSNAGLPYGFILIFRARLIILVVTFSDRRRKKSLGLLTQNFARLFLTMEVSMSSLDEATKFLLGEGHEESNMRN